MISNRNDEDEPVELTSVQGSTEAEVIKSLLESSDIIVTLVSSITQMILPFSVNGLGMIKILVPKKHRNTALKILDEYRSTQSSADSPE